jgi:hypothetical protein
MPDRTRDQTVPVGFVAMLLATCLLVALVLVTIDSSGTEDWEADCASSPAPSSTDHAEAIEAAREALLRTGHQPVLGIDVVDLNSCSETVSWKSSLAQPTASVVKLLIVLDVLDRSGISDGDDADEIHEMLAASDDDIASRLWSENGGPEIVTRQAAALQLENTWPPSDPGQWGDTRMSPADITTVYRYITSELSDDERELVTEGLADAEQTAADGFDQFFGIPDALPQSPWAVKQGWGSSAGRRVLNTTGLVKTNHTYAVAIMATWDESMDWSTATDALTEATRAMRECLDDDENSTAAWFPAGS